MGTSTNAILFYGYAPDIEGHLPYKPTDAERDADWEERYLERKYTLVKPSYTDEAYDEWWERRREYLRAEPVEIDTHCSIDYPMPFIYIRATRTTARRGYPEKIDPTTVQVDPSWNTQLQEFCRVMGIDVQEMGEPGWYLVSDWA